MSLFKKNVLLISPECFEHVWVSKHHYAAKLAARGNSVFFLNPPSTGYSSKDTDYPNLKVVDYPGFPRGFRFFPKKLRLRILLRVWNQIQEYCCSEFDLVWSFDNSVFFDLDALPNSVSKIVHIVDLNQDFQFARAAKTADICFGVIPEIVEKLKVWNKKSYLISHGVNLSSQVETGLLLKGSGETKALYLGNLEMPHIDWELAQKLSEQYPKIDFHFVGPGRAHLRQKSNVHYWGPVRSDQVLSLLKQADLLLLLYSSNYDDEYASPHKLLEYLASGTPIASTPLRSLRPFFNAGMVEELTDVSSFEKVAEKLSILNGKVASDLRIKFAEKSSYENQLNHIEKLIFSR